MRRILIAEESDALVWIITKKCQPDDVICSCADGNTALRLLAEFEPDVLLINMFLPYKSGMDVLRLATNLPPQIIAFSYLTNPYVVRALGSMGVQYVLHMPTAESIGYALEATEHITSGIRPDLRKTVIKHLQRLGISSDLDGCQMLTVGLPLFFKDPAQSLGKELYPAIACALEKNSPEAIEKAIRHVVTKAWERRNDGIWEQYFLRNGKGQISNPSNKEFLMALVRRLQQEMKE